MTRLCTFLFVTLPRWWWYWREAVGDHGDDYVSDSVRRRLAGRKEGDSWG
jgi:hypothetical protein